jgi:outer membrane protein TolC
MGPHSAKSIAVWAAMIAAPVVSARPAPCQGGTPPEAQQPATQPPASQEPVPADPVSQDPAIQDEAPAASVQDDWELSLEQALGLALRDNLGLERARSDADAARFDALSSWGVFDWTFGTSVRYIDAEAEGSSALAGGDVIDSQSTELAFDLVRPFSTGGRFESSFDATRNTTTNEFSNAPELVEDNLRFSYIHPLLRGAGYDATTTEQQIADLSSRRSIEAARGSRQRLVTDVSNSYWDLVAALEQREVRRAALRLGREQLVREEQRLAAGDGTEVDVLQAKTEIATRNEQLLQSENEVEAATDTLKSLLLNDHNSSGWRRPIVPMTALPEVAAGAEPPTWESAWQVAQDLRSELRQSRLDVDAARTRLRRAASDRLAGLDLTMNLSANSNDEDAEIATRDTFQFDYPTWSVLLRYELPLGNQTAINAEHAARERVRSALVTHQQREVEVLADVRRAVREVQYRAETVVASAQSFDLARRQLEAERARFEAELSTTFTVLEFEQSYIEAASNARRARAEYAKALSDLERAQGLAGAPR